MGAAWPATEEVAAPVSYVGGATMANPPPPLAFSPFRLPEILNILTTICYDSNIVGNLSLAFQSIRNTSPRGLNFGSILLPNNCLSDTTLCTCDLDGSRTSLDLHVLFQRQRQYQSDTRANRVSTHQLIFNDRS